MTPDAQPDLRGYNILVVEDEFLIADDIATGLQYAGADVLGPAPSVSHAMGIIAAQVRIDAGVLDINLRHEFSWPVLDALLALSIPVLLTTGYSLGGIPDRYLGVPRHAKPIAIPHLIRAVARALVVHPSPPASISAESGSTPPP